MSIAERIGAVNIDEAMRDYEAFPRMVRRKIIDRVVGPFSNWPWINRSQEWDIRFLRLQAKYGTSEGQKKAKQCMQEAMEIRKRGVSG